MSRTSAENNTTCRLLSIAVNVSVLQSGTTALWTKRQTVRSSGFDPCKLKLELTESPLVTDTDATVAKMAALKEVGIQFSLDVCTAYHRYLFNPPLTDNALEDYLMNLQGRHGNEAISQALRFPLALVT